MSAVQSVAFRVDESIHVGFGHMSRCRALAEALVRARVNVTFWCHGVRLASRNALERLGVTVVDLVDEQTFLAQNLNDSVVVVDGYHFDDVFWLRLLAARPMRTVCIDDFRGVRYWADIVICNNEEVLPQQFQLAQNSRLFLGGKYVLLKPEILKAASVASRTASKQVIMVVAGGTQQEKWIAKILSHLTKISPGMIFWVLSGRRLPESKVLYQSKLEKTKVRFFSGLNASEMLRRYSQVRCLIAPASTVMLEAFTIGCPLVTGWVADNQRNSLDYFANKGLVVNVGDLRNVSQQALSLSHAKAVRQSRIIKLKQREYIQNSKNGVDEIVNALLSDD